MSTWIHERVEVHNTTVSQIGKNYLLFSKRFQQLRPDKTCCEFCQKKFELDDSMHIAFTDKGNKFMCDPCLEIALAHGVNVTERQSEQVK